MFPAPNADLHPLIRKLESIVDLSDEEKHALLGIPVTLRDRKSTRLNSSHRT